MPNPPNALDFMLNSKLIFFLSFIILTGLLTAPMAFSEMNTEKGQSPGVLIIYSTGTPLDYYSKGPLFKKIKEMTPKGVDAVTTATPFKENCRTIAEKLAIALRERDLVVQVAEATEIKHRNEILRARLVIIGSPSRFGNVSWELKKLFDELFSQIGALEEKGLAKRRIAAFSMAEIEPSANGTLRAIKAVVGDCRGRFGPTRIFLLKHSKKEIQKRINQFAEQLAPLARD
jgi:flavorubredoxin